MVYRIPCSLRGRTTGPQRTTYRCRMLVGGVERSSYSTECGTRKGAEAEPERLATRAWGMSGPVRIQEQNRTVRSTHAAPNLDPPPFDTGRPLSSNRLCPLARCTGFKKRDTTEAALLARAASGLSLVADERGGLISSRTARGVRVNLVSWAMEHGLPQTRPAESSAITSQRHGHRQQKQVSCCTSSLLLGCEAKRAWTRILRAG